MDQQYQQPGAGPTSGSAQRLGYTAARPNFVGGVPQHDGTSYGGQWAGAIHAPISRLSEGFHLCPVDRGRDVNTWMTPVVLYGVRIDISPSGLWFDANELIQVLKSMNGQALSFLSRWFKDYKANTALVSNQIKTVVDLRLDFDVKHIRYQELAAILARGGPEQIHIIDEYRNLSAELLKLKGAILQPIDITPGKEVKIPVRSSGPGPVSSEGYRLCPQARVYGQSIVMTKIKLLGQTLDASEYGIWFDHGELGALLQGLQKRNGGILAAIANILRQSKISDDLQKAVSHRLALIKLRDQTHRELEQARAVRLVRVVDVPIDDSQERLLTEKYVRQNAELMEAEDITPPSLRA